MDAVNHARASVTPAAVVAPGRPLPAEMPAAMPVQHLHQWVRQSACGQIPRGGPDGDGLWC